MKFPSLFRTPGHQRFNVTPRYYDPVKEDLDARTSQIKAEMAAEKGEEIDAEYSKMSGSRISGSFARRNVRKGPINIMQMVILALLIGLVAGYWYFGNLGLYVIITISSVLLYLKIKRII